jgi:hypothetical protein
VLPYICTVWELIKIFNFEFFKFYYGTEAVQSVPTVGCFLINLHEDKTTKSKVNIMYEVRPVRDC